LVQGSTLKTALVVDTFHSTDTPQDDAWRTSLRQRMRRQRAALSDSLLRESSEAVAIHLRAELKHAQHIAGYLAVKGEQAVAPAMRLARSLGATTAVPVVQGQSMSFVVIDDATRFTHNRFGIPEPELGPELGLGPALSTNEPATAPLLPTDLDLVLVPLVAFDLQGNRLGMGGGFYDRLFATAEGRPRLVGVAHDFQRVETLEPMSWDVPLDAVVTASGYQAINTDQAKNKR
jgi:5-formyltetrahydrofolate cyclo-ligase